MTFQHVHENTDKDNLMWILLIFTTKWSDFSAYLIPVKYVFCPLFEEYSK